MCWHPNSSTADSKDTDDDDFSRHPERIVEISHLVTRERQARDRNWWQIWRECYTPDATVEVSWMHGPATEYIDRSIDISSGPGGLPGNHRVGQPAIDVNGSRAVAEVPMAIEFRGIVRKVEVDVISRFLMLNRVERDDNRWRIAESRVIFQFDTIEPTIPGTPFTLEPADFDGMRPSYRALTILVPPHRHTVSRECHGVDRPDQVAELYGNFYAWAGIPLDATAEPPGRER
jgi:hypothetical protein